MKGNRTLSPKMEPSVYKCFGTYGHPLNTTPPKAPRTDLERQPRSISLNGKLLLHRLPLGFTLNKMTNIANRKRVGEVDRCEHLREEYPPTEVLACCQRLSQQYS